MSLAYLNPNAGHRPPLGIERLVLQNEFQTLEYFASVRKFPHD